MNDAPILVTGGCGFIGVHVLSALMGKGFRDITVLDNLFNGKRGVLTTLRQPVKLLTLDVSSHAAYEAVANGRFEAVIHLAALHYIPYCDAHPSEVCRVNIEGTQNLLCASIAGGVRRFFLASTAAVYSPSDAPHGEDDPLRPIDIYGLSKVTNEQQVALAARASDCKFSVGRFFNAVGAFETNPHLVPEIIRRLRTSTRIEIGNVTPKRDYIHSADVADAVLAMTFGATQSMDVCNIGSGESYSVRDIVDGIAGIKGAEITLIPSSKYIRQVDRPVLQSNNAKIRARYGWFPRRSLRDCLRDAIEFDGDLANAELAA